MKDTCKSLWVQLLPWLGNVEWRFRGRPCPNRRLGLTVTNEQCHTHTLKRRPKRFHSWRASHENGAKSEQLDLMCFFFARNRIRGYKCWIHTGFDCWFGLQDDIFFTSTSTTDWNFLDYFLALFLVHKKRQFCWNCFHQLDSYFVQMYNFCVPSTKDGKFHASLGSSLGRHAWIRQWLSRWYWHSLSAAKCNYSLMKVTDALHLLASFSSDIKSYTISRYSVFVLAYDVYFLQTFNQKAGPGLSKISFCRRNLSDALSILAPESAHFMSDCSSLENCKIVKWTSVREKFAQHIHDITKTL